MKINPKKRLQSAADRDFQQPHTLQLICFNSSAIKFLSWQVATSIYGSLTSLASPATSSLQQIPFSLNKHLLPVFLFFVLFLVNHCSMFHFSLILVFLLSISILKNIVVFIFLLRLYFVPLLFFSFFSIEFSSSLLLPVFLLYSAVFLYIFLRVQTPTHIFIYYSFYASFVGLNSTCGRFLACCHEQPFAINNFGLYTEINY